jgi:hypothetical protein
MEGQKTIGEYYCIAAHAVLDVLEKLDIELPSGAREAAENPSLVEWAVKTHLRPREAVLMAEGDNLSMIADVAMGAFLIEFPEYLDYAKRMNDSDRLRLFQLAKFLLALSFESDE